jgi:sugar phosphate isomerase/epimerase
MNCSIHKYLQIGILSFMAFPDTMKGEGNTMDSIRKIALDDYFDVIEITHIKDPEVRKNAQSILKQSHLKVCYTTHPRLLSANLNPNDLDESNRKKAEAVLIDSIDEAEFMGSTGISFLAGKYDEAKKEEAYDQLIKTTCALCDYAKQKNMTVVMEVFDYDFDKKVLIGPAPYAAAFAEDMQSRYDNFGLLIDLSHIPLTHETSKEVIQTLKPYIVHFHIGNCVMVEHAEGYGDTHPRFGFQNGQNDTLEVLEFLRLMQNEGFFVEENPYILSFEVKPLNNEDSEVVIANAKRVLNRAWALL